MEILQYLRLLAGFNEWNMDVELVEVFQTTR